MLTASELEALSEFIGRWLDAISGGGLLDCYGKLSIDLVRVTRRSAGSDDGHTRPTAGQSRGTRVQISHAGCAQAAGGLANPIGTCPPESGRTAGCRAGYQYRRRSRKAW